MGESSRDRIIRIKSSLEVGHPSSSINGNNTSSNSCIKNNRPSKDRLARGRIEGHSRHGTTVSHRSGDNICRSTSYRRKSLA